MWIFRLDWIIITNDKFSIQNFRSMLIDHVANRNKTESFSGITVARQCHYSHCKMEYTNGCCVLLYNRIQAIWWHVAISSAEICNIHIAHCILHTVADFQLICWNLELAITLHAVHLEHVMSWNRITFIG